MVATPFVRPLKLSGGTLYTFQSGSEDLNRCLSSTSEVDKFRFSKWALLNLPSIDRPSNGQNYFQFDTIDTVLSTSEYTSNQELNLAQSFENYALNFEAAILSQTNYDSSNPRTVTERVWWKWLKELGVIRWQAADATQSTSATQLYVEVPDDTSSSTERYQRVVQCLGEFDVVGHIKSSWNSYNELYLAIPSEIGNTQVPLFNTVSDNNYSPGLSIANLNAVTVDRDFLYGRTSSSVHPYGLSLKSYYDQGPYTNGIVTTVDGTTQLLYPVAQERSYNTENSFTNDSIETIQRTISTPVSKTVTYLRSRLDGVQLDFNVNDYRNAANANLVSLSQLNQIAQAGDFNFNTVLIYYDVYDPNDATKWTTNLFGVFFINPVQDIAGGASQIQTLPKKRPNFVLESGGTAYDLRINYKISSSVEQVPAQTTVNEYSTISLTMFMDSLSQLLQVADAEQQALGRFATLSSQYQSLSDLLQSSYGYDKLRAEIDALKVSFNANSLLWAESDSLQTMLANLENDVRNLLAGKFNTNLSIDFDAVLPGPGIFLDKSVSNQITISSRDRGWNWLGSSPSTSWVQNITKISLSPGNTLARFAYQGIWATPLVDQVLQINDMGGWQIGQVLRVVFNFDFVLGSTRLLIQTDSLGQATNLVPWSTVLILGASDLLTWDPSGAPTYKPIIEITCIVPPSTLGAGTFIVDKIR